MTSFIHQTVLGKPFFKSFFKSSLQDIQRSSLDSGYVLCQDDPTLPK